MVERTAQRLINAHGARGCGGPERGSRRAGASRACTRSPRGDILSSCWGSGAGVDLAVGVPVETAQQVATGGAFACLVTTEGNVRCWGEEWWDYGYITDAPTTGTFTRIAVGGYHACAVQDNGAVVCWGQPDTGATAVPGTILGHVVDVVASALSTCALLDDGSVHCWGGRGWIRHRLESLRGHFPPAGDLSGDLGRGRTHVWDQDGRWRHDRGRHPVLGRRRIWRVRRAVRPVDQA